MAIAAVLDADAPPVARLPVRQVAAVVVGNWLEFYDFLTFAFFAIQIGNTFFPSASPTTRLLSSLATFGVGFFTRPIGGFVIGSLGDRVGRKPAMFLSFSLMGIAIAGLALTPSYRSIGVAAPILVVCFRLLQGFALGGEVGPTTAFLVEAGPASRRGLYGSMQYMSQDFAVLCAGLVGVVLANLLSAQALQNWGWRIAFLLGAAIVPFGLMMRRTLAETLEAEERTAQATPIDIKPFLWIAGLGVLLLASGTVCNYSIDYMTTYAGSTLHMSARIAFGATVVSGLFGMCCDPIGGLLSDRFGRKPLMIFPWLLMFLVAVPTFYAIAQFKTVAALYAGVALIQVLISIGTPSVLIAITESLPKRVRSGGLATIYAVAISTFGGTTQFTIAWLIARTGNPHVPGWYIMGFVAVGLLAMFMLRETAPVRNPEFRSV